MHTLHASNGAHLWIKRTMYHNTDKSYFKALLLFRLAMLRANQRFRYNSQTTSSKSRYKKNPQKIAYLLCDASSENLFFSASCFNFPSASLHLNCLRSFKIEIRIPWNQVEEAQLLLLILKVRCCWSSFLSTGPAELLWKWWGGGGGEGGWIATQSEGAENTFFSVTL